MVFTQAKFQRREADVPDRPMNPEEFDPAPIIAVIAADERVLAAWLLGSAARGTLRDDSDVDIALLSRDPARLGAVERCELGARIALAIGREVDPGSLDSGDLVYAREAILGGRRIYARDPAAADARAATLLGLYARFADDRREVLDAYRAA